MAIVITVLARVTPLPVPGLRRWMQGSWLIFIALLLLGLRDWIAHLASVTVGNGALMLGYVFWLAGTHEYHRQQFRWTRWVVATVLAVVATTWFVYVEPSFRMRVVIVAGLCTLINARHAFVMLRMPTSKRSLRTLGVPMAATLLIGLTLIYAWRAGHATLFPQGSTGLLTQDAIQVIYTSSFTVCNLMLVVAFATLASDHVRARIEEESVRDPLTGALNRRAFSEALDLELARSLRYGRSFCVAMIDVDHFKHVNDQFGHPCGDRVLVRICRRVAGLMRPNDVFARYGGEEFVVLMPETTLEFAMQVAERLRSEIDRTVDDKVPHVTVSVGITEWSARDVTAELLMARADEALYAAKAGGRNRIATTQDLAFG